MFSITLHVKDLSLLENIQKTLGVGKISKSKNLSAIYAVDSMAEIPVIIDHFDRYPLITQKKSDYLLFRQCFEIIKQKGHLTEKGLLDIVSIKSSLNLGLSEELNKAFPNITPTERPVSKFVEIPDPYWLSGFVNGEGSFHIVARNSETKSMFARFSIHLHRRDLEVLKGISIYFKQLLDKNIEKTSMLDSNEKKIDVQDNSVNFQISKFSDIKEVIIPFFNKYALIGIKNLDFEDFKKICEILESKLYLKNSNEYEKILRIKSGMNLNRKW